MTEDRIKQNKEEIEALLLMTERPGIHNLLAEMTLNGFFESACSTSHHLAEKGGLAEHSLNVFRVMQDLNLELEAKLPIDSIVICSLLHDLGKMGDHSKQNYIDNMVRSKKKDEEGNYPLIRSEAKPYITNPDLLYIPHEVRSIAIAQRFIYLTEEEEHAIYYHNGKYTHIGYDLKETELSMLLHFADLWASRAIEKEEN